MQDFINFLKALSLGFTTGLFISIPLGPSGIESVKRTMSKGFKEGFKVSIGAISADLSYLLLINCGLSSILDTNKNTEALFWIVSGLILALIGYISIREKKVKKNFNFNFVTTKLSSLPFLLGFIITFCNPMTLSLWLTLSGTVIRAWYYVSMVTYYTFIFAIVLGMITWFAFLNYLSLQGKQILKPTHFRRTSNFLMLIILVIGICFILFGLKKLLF